MFDIIPSFHFSIVPHMFLSSSHQVPQSVPQRVFPIAARSNPICIAQSPPLLTYIGGPKDETLHLAIESSCSSCWTEWVEMQEQLCQMACHAIIDQCVRWQPCNVHGTYHQHNPTTKTSFKRQITMVAAQTLPGIYCLWPP